jgi:hypothetical protein
VRPSAPLVAAALAQAAFAVVPRLEPTPWFRYEVPLLPLLAAMAGAGLASVGLPRRRHALVAALIAIMVTPAWWLRHPSQYSPSQAEIALARWLRTYQPDARLALYDIGAVPYFSHAPFVFDSNPHGPLHPPLANGHDADGLIWWSPTWIVLPPADAPAVDPLAHVAADPRFAARYTRMFVLDGGDGYVFTVWRRNDVRLSTEALIAAEGLRLYQSRGSRLTGGSPKYS